MRVLFICHRATWMGSPLFSLLKVVSPKSILFHILIFPLGEVKVDDIFPIPCSGVFSLLVD